MTDAVPVLMLSPCRKRRWTLSALPGKADPSEVEVADRELLVHYSTCVRCQEHYQAERVIVRYEPADEVQGRLS